MQTALLQSCRGRGLGADTHLGLRLTLTFKGPEGEARPPHGLPAGGLTGWCPREAWARGHPPRPGSGRTWPSTATAQGPLRPRKAKPGAAAPPPATRAEIWRRSGRRPAPVAERARSQLGVLCAGPSARGPLRGPRPAPRGPQRPGRRRPGVAEPARPAGAAEAGAAALLVLGAHRHGHPEARRGAS